MFLIKYKTSVQVTEDHWEMVTKEKLFPETATIKEIKDWVGAIKLFEVNLSEPE